jgi:GDP-L-fucose synthase
LFVDDIARGLMLAAERLPGGRAVNIGSGRELSIRDLVAHIVQATGFAGPVHFDVSRVGGDPRRVADIGQARAVLGFEPLVGLREGLDRTVEWYRAELGAPVRSIS